MLIKKLLDERIAHNRISNRMKLGIHFNQGLRFGKREDALITQIYNEDEIAKGKGYVIPNNRFDLNVLSLSEGRHYTSIN